MRLTALAAATAAALAFGMGAPTLAQTKGQTKEQQPAPAPAQQADDGKGQRFDDWLVRCDQDQGEPERCFMVQNVLAQNDEGKRIPLLNVIIGHGQTDGEQITVMQFTVPLGLYLPSGIAFDVGQGEPVRIAIEVCTNKACVARYRLDEATRIAMQKGDRATVQLVQANRKAIDVPVSLKGFTKAYAALK